MPTSSPSRSACASRNGPGRTSPTTAWPCAAGQEQVLADLVQARETLLDPERRSAYDSQRTENPVAVQPPAASPDAIASSAATGDALPHWKFAVPS